MSLFFSIILSVFIYSCAYAAPVPHRMIAQNEPWPTYVRQLYPQGVTLKEEIRLIGQNMSHFKCLYEDQMQRQGLTERQKEIVLNKVQIFSKEMSCQSQIINPFAIIIPQAALDDCQKSSKANVNDVNFVSRMVHTYYENLKILNSLFEKKNDPYLAQYDLSEFISSDFNAEMEKRQFIDLFRGYQNNDISFERISERTRNAATKVVALCESILMRLDAFKEFLKCQLLSSQLAPSIISVLLRHENA